MQGYLATVTNLSERNFIDQTIFSGVKPDNVYVGGSDAYQEGVWRWVTGPEGQQDGGNGLIFFDGTNRTDIPTNDLWAQGISNGQQIMTSYFREDITGLPEMGLVAKQLWQQSKLGPDDIQTAVIYDHFTPFVLPQLEEFGFVKRGEAKEFIRAGHHARGGKMPINTHGGQLGEAYIHGMNGIAEGVRQVRGSAVNQVADVHNVLVTAGTGVPTSGLILGTD